MEDGGHTVICQSGPLKEDEEQWEADRITEGLTKIKEKPIDDMTNESQNTSSSMYQPEARERLAEVKENSMCLDKGLSDSCHAASAAAGDDYADDDYAADDDNNDRASADRVELNHQQIPATIFKSDVSPVGTGNNSQTVGTGNNSQKYSSGIRKLLERLTDINRILAANPRVPGQLRIPRFKRKQLRARANVIRQLRKKGYNYEKESGTKKD